jgi:small subunit ribosomal protein S27e
MMKKKFLKLICPRCRLSQITFGKASTWLKCENCNKLLIKPTGGKAKIKAKIEKII